MKNSSFRLKKTPLNSSMLKRVLKPIPKSGISFVQTRFRTTAAKLTRINKSSSSGTESSSTRGGKNSNDQSFIFQLFMLVGSMGAGYTLGKSIVLQDPPKYLFPSGSTTTLDDLPELKDVGYADHNKFKKCISRILSTVSNVDANSLTSESKVELISEDLFQIMIEPSSVIDIFSTKIIEGIEDKKLELYPESTEQVSSILKFCHDYKVPVFTHKNIVKSKEIGYSLFLDLSALKNVKVDEQKGYVNVQRNADLKQLKFFNSLSSLDLLFGNLGIQFNDSFSRLVAGKFDKNEVLEITVVLPSGDVTTLHNNDTDSQLFQLLTGGSDTLGIITEIKLKYPASKTDEKLIVFGFNDLEKYNQAVADLHSNYPNLSIGFVDSGGCKPLNEKYGNFVSFGVLKVNESDYSRVFKRLSAYDNDKFKTITVYELPFKDSQLYYSSKVPSSKEVSTLLITNDFFGKDIVAYTQTTPQNETQMIADPSIISDIDRRIKLSLDPSKILNPNIGGISLYR